MWSYATRPCAESLTQQDAGSALTNALSKLTIKGGNSSHVVGSHIWSMAKKGTCSQCHATLHYMWWCDLVFGTLYRKFPDSQWGVSVVLTAYAREVSEQFCYESNLPKQFCCEFVVEAVLLCSEFVVGTILLRVCCGNSFVTSLF